MSDSHRLREIERELTALAGEVREIANRIGVDSVKAQFAKQDCYALSAVLYGAATDAKSVRIPRRAKVPA